MATEEDLLDLALAVVRDGIEHRQGVALVLDFAHDRNVSLVAVLALATRRRRTARTDLLLAAAVDLLTAAVAAETEAWQRSERLVEMGPGRRAPRRLHVAAEPWLSERAASEAPGDESDVLEPAQLEADLERLRHSADAARPAPGPRRRLRHR